MAKLILNPSLAGRREIPLSFAKTLTIGRDPTNDLVLPDSLVSRRHAVVERRAGQFVLRDCNSANGSAVNGERVSEWGLRDGDQVTIGMARLVFREEAESESGKVIPHPSAAPFRCLTCGGEYRRGDVFCGGCGSAVVRPAVEARRRLCDACGGAVRAAARFCSHCGRVMEADREAGGPEDASPALEESPNPRTAGSMAFAPEREIAGRFPGRSVRAQSRTVPDPIPEAPVPFEPAEPGQRLGAALVDAVFVFSAQVVMLAPALWYWWAREAPRTPADVKYLPVLATALLVVLAFLLGAAYHVYFWSVRGATPGKELFDLQVQTEHGRSPIGVRRAVLRIVGYCAGVASLGIGFLMILFGDAGLQDRIAGTRVARASQRSDSDPPTGGDGR